MQISSGTCDAFGKDKGEGKKTMLALIAQL